METIKSVNDFLWKLQIDREGGNIRICLIVVGIIVSIFTYNYIMWRKERRSKKNLINKKDGGHYPCAR